MKARGRFISFLLIVDTFFVSYAAGFHSRHVLVIDPSLPAISPAKPNPPKHPAAAPAAEKKLAPASSKGATQKKPVANPSKNGAASTGKESGKSKNTHKQSKPANKKKPE